MKFRDLLEAYWKQAKIYQKDIDVFKNPNRSEVKEIISNSTYKEIRGGVFKNDVYAWDGGEMDHGGIQTNYNFRFDWVFIYNQKLRNIELYGVSDISEDPKKNQEMEDRLKRMFGATKIK